MPRAHAEATLGLIERLRRDHAGVVTVQVQTAIHDDGDGPPIYNVTVDSPLIGEDMPHVEIVLDRDGLRFKPWADLG